MTNDMSPPPAFDRRMLEALICPQTPSTLEYDAAAHRQPGLSDP